MQKEQIQQMLNQLPDSVDVDEFVRDKVKPEYQGLVAELRALLRKAAPAAREAMSYGLPMYFQSKSAFAWISPNQKGISLGFREGVQFEDRYGLLRGSVKHARHIQHRICLDDEISKTLLRADEFADDRAEDAEHHRDIEAGEHERQRVG